MNSPLPDPHSSLVQIYATASQWQAEAASHRLREAGIEARVTGHHLGPAIKNWQRHDAHYGVLVHESRAKSAYDILTHWLPSDQSSSTSDEESMPASTSQRGQREEWDVPSEDDNHKESRTAVTMGTWLSKLMGIAGLCVLIMGFWTAWTNARLLNRFSGETMALAVDAAEQYLERRQTPFPPLEGWPTHYRYEVEGEAYHFTRMLGQQFPEEIPIRYDPADPASLGPTSITPPIWCVFMGCFMGGFLMLASWQFVRAPH